MSDELGDAAVSQRYSSAIVAIGCTAAISILLFGSLFWMSYITNYADSVGLPDAAGYAAAIIGVGVLYVVAQAVFFYTAQKGGVYQ